MLIIIIIIVIYKSQCYRILKMLMFQIRNAEKTEERKSENQVRSMTSDKSNSELY